MKRINYIVLSALTLTSLLVIPSCSKNIDEVQGVSTTMGNTISVNAMIGSDVTTKAFAAEQNTTADSLKSICLSAWNESTQAMTDATYSKSNNAWSTTDGPYYWATGAYTFIGWAKNNVAAKATEILSAISQDPIESTTQVKGTYTVDASVATGESGSGTVSQSDPVLAVATYTGKPDNNSVDLQFQHLLSRISINLYAPVFTDSTVCLLDFGFKGVSTSGTFTYGTTATTSSAFSSSCWASSTTGNVGEWVEDKNDANEYYWWPTYSGNNPFKAVAPTAENAYTYTHAPIVPSSLDTSFPKLTTYYTDNSTKKEVTSAPWLNVIPGSNIAGKLQVRLNIFQGGVWEVKTLKADLPNTLKVGDEVLTEYKPGYQYVYNIRVLGQNTDDASVDDAKLTVQGVIATTWKTTSTAQASSSNIGVGNSLQNLIDKIAANGGYGTIKLTENVVLDTTVTVPDSCNISIDLNGHNITTKSGTTVNPLFKVAAGGELTFEDTGATDGSVTAAANTSIIKLEDGDDTKAGGKATINDGIFNVSGDNGAVIESTTNTNHGTSEINGGTISKTGAASGKESPFTGSTPTINGGTFTGGYTPEAPTGYQNIKTSDNPVTYITVPAGAVATPTTGSGNVTAD